MLLTAAPAAAQDSVVVGVVYDGPNDRMGAQQEKFVEELLVLTEREFNVQIKDFSGDWTRESMLGVLDEAYADPTVDFVLVIGFVTNQLAATREVFTARIEELAGRPPDAVSVERLTRRLDVDDGAELSAERTLVAEVCDGCAP